MTDSGRGVPPELADRIFEAFEQGERGTTRQYGGTGLGLTICQELAQLMGGDIALKSTLGFGSTFTVSLLLDQDTDKASQDGTNIPDKLVDLFSHINDIRILLIDDVYTTGATVKECAKTLIKGGAARVDVLTLARVVRDDLDF